LTIVLASLYLGNILGSLVLIVPAGIGIREVAAAAIGVTLAPSTPAALIVAAAVMFRIWQIAVDVICFVLGLVLIRKSAAS
jgi:uncharacterized membrane protein YbhN (UPF0104 family)